VKVLVDLRSLQDPSFVGRGIGRHGQNLLEHAPRRHRLIGLTDPDLPPLAPKIRDMFERVIFNARMGADADLFLQLSPMTHDPLTVAPILQEPAVSKLAVVYDFIPYHTIAAGSEPAITQADYLARLGWLAGYDVFFPISQSVGEELQRILGVASSRVRVTGAPLATTLNPPPGYTNVQSRTHILVVGGLDPRKNVDVVVRAHAASRPLQAARIPLYIAGSYGVEDRSRFQALAVATGGSASLVMVPGQITDEALTSLLERAFAVVCASWDEGFSLPIIEGMAFGAPVLASDIPVHRELVKSEQDRFAPGDAARLTGLLEKQVLDKVWREGTITRQAGVWSRFSGSKVAGRVWREVDKREPRTMTAAPAKRARVALVTPVHPAPSGVADHSAALARELGRLVDLDVYTPTLLPWSVSGARTVLPLSAVPFTSPAYDGVISAIGNSHLHLEIFELARAYGGTFILHDARMLGFYSLLLGQDRAMAVASRELGRTVSLDQLRVWLSDEGRAEARFLGDLAERANAVIVHSRMTRDLIRERHGLDANYIPLSLQRDFRNVELSEQGQKLARARLGIGNSELAIASFGHVIHSKAPEECVWAVDILRRWGLPATLTFVGGIEPTSELNGRLVQLIGRLGLQKHVRLFSSLVDEATYRDYLLAADVALQLRTYDLGQVSGALTDCMTVGLPTVVTQGIAAGTDAPDELVERVPNELSALLIAEALDRRLKAGRHATDSVRARERFCAERSARSYARKLCDIMGLAV
jgi:glycosyltransferase involved in cell wall biosynthesis